MTPSYLCDGDGCGGAVERPLPIGKGSAGTGMSVSCARSFDVVLATLMAWPRSRCSTTISSEARGLSSAPMAASLLATVYTL